jgi:hypothetical protein
MPACYQTFAVRSSSAAFFQTTLQYRFRVKRCIVFGMFNATGYLFAGEPRRLR